MSLDRLIDEVYGKHQAELQAKEEAKKLQQRQETEEAIAHFRTDFDAIISPDLQLEMGIEIHTVYQKPVYVCAKFSYKEEKFVIARSFGSREYWRVEKNGKELFDSNPSDAFLNLLLLELGKIRASYVEPQAELMTLEQAAGTLDDCLALAEDVYNHRHDFIHNPEEFGNNLKAAICLIKRLSSELTGIEEDSE